MSEWKTIIKETYYKHYHIEGTKDVTRARSLEKAIAGELPDDSSVEWEVEDQVEIS